MGFLIKLHCSKNCCQERSKWCSPFIPLLKQCQWKKVTWAFKSALYTLWKIISHQLAFHMTSQKKSILKKAIVAPPVFFAGTLCSLGFPSFPTINWDFQFVWAHSPLCSIKVIFHIIRHENLKKCDLCKRTKEPGKAVGLVGWLTVRWRCVQAAWSGWRWPDRCNLEPTWRTWTPPHTQHDLEKMEKRTECHIPEELFEWKKSKTLSE